MEFEEIYHQYFQDVFHGIISAFAQDEITAGRGDAGNF